MLTPSILLAIMMLQLLEVFNAEETHIMKSVKANYSNTDCSSSMWPIFHNLNMTANSVEKHCFAVLNEKLQVTIKIQNILLTFRTVT